MARRPRQGVGCAGLAARARAGQRARRPRARRRGAEPRTTSATAGSPSGCPSAPWVYRRRVRRRRGRCCASTASTTRAPCSSTVRSSRTHDGMFAPFDVDVARSPTGGASARGRRAPGARRASRRSAARAASACTSARMNYGWDFCPRLVHQGIWRSVSLADARRSASRPSRSRTASARSRSTARSCCAVDGPELWWPNGLGEQRLYVEIGGRAATSASARSSSPTTTALVVNGERDLRQGLELVPARPALRRAAPGEARAPARLAARRERQPAARVGRRADRDEEFYELCDRLGMLVWQEFSQSSSGHRERARRATPPSSR